MTVLAGPTTVHLRALFAPKDGNSEGQYEDAFAHSALDAPRVTVAVADGASSAVFAREWATLLVKHFAVHGFPPTDPVAAQQIAALGGEWHTLVSGKATSWHAQEKLENGSEATLLVVTFDQEKWMWEACSIGDNCVFLIRRNKLRFAFPITKSARFDDRPPLVSSRVGQGKRMPAVVRYTEKFEPGDRFLFLTDALSGWFLSQFEARRKPWHDLPETDEAFPAWLKAERESGRLKNDDVTLLDLQF